MGAQNCNSFSNYPSELSQHLRTCSELVIENQFNELNQARELDSNDIEFIVSCISQNSKVTWLDLKFGVFPLKAFQGLCEYIKENKSITYLDLSSNSLSFSHIKLMAQAIVCNSHISTLILNSNSIDQSSAFILTEAIKSNKSIKKLLLADNDLSDQSIQLLCRSVLISSQITELNLSSNKLNLLGFRYIADLLKDRSSKLQEINLSNNNISEKALKYLILSCEQNEFQTAIMTSSKNILPLFTKELSQNKNSIFNCQFFTNCSGFMMPVLKRNDTSTIKSDLKRKIVL